ncbi:hypothetical protein CE91St65_38100 [[Clostridium] symbiosum]|nr:hypothetical protein HMPREF1020_02597 [Clostridium sp. 7_3_54FAA]BDF25930.1 hypothetical protein CE91St65_38100 [[Clostridium] symbiosum]BDF30835.1 hypothetical protein CE91St66_38120 [[Clostridium] symbiosum]
MKSVNRTVDGCSIIIFKKTLTIKLVCANLICGLERTNFGLCVLMSCVKR